MAYEWLLIPAIGTFQVATFIPRAAVARGFHPAPLAFLAMCISLAFVSALGFAIDPARTVEQLTQPDSLLIALAGGGGGGLGLCCVYTALKQRATGPVITVASMSILLPISLGVALHWDQAPRWWNYAGVALSLIGTLLINLGKAKPVEGERFDWVFLALGAVVCSGISQTAQKYIGVCHPLPPGTARYGFMIAYYLAAVLVLSLFLAWLRQPITWRVWPYAAGQGLNSCAQFVCMLMLLQHVNTAVVLVTFTGCGIVLVMLLSAAVLRERYRPLVWIGCAISIVGLVTVHWK